MGWVRGVVSVAIAGICLVAVAPAQAATESSAYQVDGAHDGYVYGAGVVPPLSDAWTLNLGYANPYVAIAEGQVFGIAAPSSDERDVDAIDLSTGKISWSQPVTSTGLRDVYVAVDGGKVFTATTAPVPGAGDGEEIGLSAYDAQTGAPLWSDLLSGQWSPDPLVAQNGVIYMSAEGFGTTVYAIRETDGKQLWDDSLFAGGPVTVAGGIVVSVGGCGYVWGLNAETGANEWTDYEGCDGSNSLPASFDGAGIWTPARYTGEIEDPRSGTVVGQFSGAPPAFGYGEAIQSFATTNGSMLAQAINPSSQSVLWSFDAGNDGSMPLLADGYVFEAGSTNGQAYIWGLAACTGQFRWVSQLDSPAGASLAAGDGYLVVPTDNGLIAFKGKGDPTGDPPDCLPSPDSSPAPSGGTGSTTPVGITPVPTANAPASGPTQASSEPTSNRTQTPSSRLKRRVSLVRLSCKRQRFNCSIRFRMSGFGVVSVRLLEGRRVIARTVSRLSRGRHTVRLRFAHPLSTGQLTLSVVLRVRGRRIGELTWNIRPG